MAEITVKKYITDWERMHTYFEFEPGAGWDQFDPLCSIFTDHLGYKMEDKLEGIWDKYCTLSKGDFVFQLMLHDDFGTCLRNPEKQDEAYYAKLEALANEVAEGITTNRYGLRKR